jgi:hypothetical protein
MRCHNQKMPTATDLLWLAAMVVLMGLGVVFALWHFRRIRDGRMDPLIGPEWPRPASPPTGIRWGTEQQDEIEDEHHVGRPFPPPGDSRTS